MLEQVRAMTREGAPEIPVAELIGMRLVDAQPGEATAELEVETRHTNRAGTVFGGILCDLADYVMGAAYITTLQPGEWFTTLELKINFLRAVREARLRAVARMVKHGRTVGMVECDVLDPAGELVARASCTCLTTR